jgi:ATP-dependent exoDNAse (exonuclease V) beta subunit
VATGGRRPAVGLTDEQEEAVERRRGALLLAANAGSGKTTVLVERFVRAVHEDGISPGRILAITFTERAAGELRERVRRRLHELGDRAAARETETAFVSTIHGFCARVLRAHPLAAGLAPGFGVLDEGTAAGLRQEAFERALAGWMTGEAELDLAAACGVDQLAVAISRAHDELRSRGMTRPRLPDARARREPGAALAGLIAAGETLASELAGIGPRPGVRVEGALGQLERVAAARLGGSVFAAPTDRPPAGGEIECGGRGVGLEELRLHRGAAALKTPAADAYEAARLGCCEARDDALGVVGLDLLGRLLEAFAEEFARLKRTRGVLDFDDLELCARDLLAGERDVAARWAERFELLMVDELQDTNPREMSILGALDRGNLFTVGDEFQSIYRFRHADVGIFRDRRRELAGEGGVRALSRNFRSRPAILAAINATFGPIFGEDFVRLIAGRDDGPVGLVAGRDDGPVGLVAGREDRPVGLVAGRDDGFVAEHEGGSGGEPLVELMLSDSAGWQETAPGEEPGPGPPWRRAEAALLARRIEELIVTGVARPEDIVVLLRYATAAGVYGQALADRGIPIAAALGGGFYAAVEICDLAAYMRVLANPLDDVALYGVLASPLCGLRADGLAVIGLAARALDRPPWEVVAAAGGGDPAASAALGGLTASEAERLAAVRALIEAERRAAAGVGLAELIVRSGYRERALSRPGAALGQANLRKLIRLAGEFEAREGRDLRGFADRLAAGRLGSTREQHAQLAETAAVRLMTVHAAKGLEFPVVCVADLGHGPPIGAPVILTDGAQVGLRLPTLEGGKPAESFAYTELRARQGKAALAEEQRIGYVAMTRARERLILSGAAHFAHWPSAGPFAAAIAWLAPAMVVDLADRLAGPTGVSEIDLGGARVRLTLTAAGDMPALRDAVIPPREGAPPEPWDPVAAPPDPWDPLAAPADPWDPLAARAEPWAGRRPPEIVAGRGRRRSRQRGPSVADEQIALFAEGDPALLAGNDAALPVAPGPADHSQSAPRPAGFPPVGSTGVSSTADHQPAPVPEPAAPARAGSRTTRPPPAHAATPPPGSVSYSSLVDYGRCGYGYYLRRVLGLPRVPPPPGLEPAGGYDAAERGRIVHALLERLDFADPAVPAPELVRAQALGREPSDEEVAAIAELVGAFARSPLCRRLAAAETVGRETGFATPVGDLLVNGFIDVVAHEADGRMLIVDYKSDRIDPETDLSGRVSAEYDVQRQIYGLAGLRTGATSVEVAYCFLRRPDETVAVRYTQADAPLLETGLLGLAAPLLAGRFDVSPRPHLGLCATCPGRARFCSWEETLTLRADPGPPGPRQAAVQDA